LADSILYRYSSVTVSNLNRVEKEIETKQLKYLDIIAKDLEETKKFIKDHFSEPDEHEENNHVASD